MANVIPGPQQVQGFFLIAKSMKAHRHGGNLRQLASRAGVPEGDLLIPWKTILKRLEEITISLSNPDRLPDFRIGTRGVAIIGNHPSKKLRRRFITSRGSSL
jgi:hypothetical protein